MDFHPYANIFPLLEGEAFEELVEDIREHGLREPIVVHEGKILDGRNRWRAACKAGVLDAAAPAWRGEFVLNDGFREFGSEAGDGDDPLAFVVSRNIHRRHLTPSQRGLIAAEIETLRHGGDRKSADQDANLHVDRATAAEQMAVSERTVATGAVVRDHGTLPLKLSVRRGDVSLHAAAAIARLPEPEQNEIVARGPDEIRAAAKKLRAEQTARKRAAREQKERELGARQRALPDTRYGVIYADPPWRFDPRSRDTGMDRAADNHYPTLTTREISQLAVRDIAADDAVLFLWATAPMLPDALGVMDAWGFTYKSHVVWRKVGSAPARSAGADPGEVAAGAISGVRAPAPADRAGEALSLGLGYWVRNAHELLLVGTRGQVPAPAPGTQFPSVIDAPPGRHSEKPARFAELIESYYPSLPRVELFARAARDGWAVWGNEVDGPDGESRDRYTAAPPAAAAAAADADAAAADADAGPPGEAEELAILEAIAAGTPPPAGCGGLALLTVRNIVRVLKSGDMTLTAAGKRRLELLRQQQADAARLADRLSGLPDGVPALTRLYRAEIQSYDRAVMSGDEDAIGYHAGRLEDILVKANGGTSFGVLTNAAPAAVIEGARAPNGQVPLWGQAGRFVIEVDGCRALVEPPDTILAIPLWNVMAVDAAAPFISNTGYRSVQAWPRAGMRVDDHARALLRDRLPALSAPETVYELPDGTGEPRRIPVREALESTK